MCARGSVRVCVWTCMHTHVFGAMLHTSKGSDALSFIFAVFRNSCHAFLALIVLMKHLSSSSNESCVNAMLANLARWFCFAASQGLGSLPCLCWVWCTYPWGRCCSWIIDCIWVCDCDFHKLLFILDWVLYRVHVVAWNFGTCWSFGFAVFADLMRTLFLYDGDLALFIPSQLGSFECLLHNPAESIWTEPSWALQNAKTVGLAIGCVVSWESCCVQFNGDDGLGCAGILQL